MPFDAVCGRSETLSPTGPTEVAHDERLVVAWAAARGRPTVRCGRPESVAARRSLAFLSKRRRLSRSSCMPETDGQQ